MARKTIAQLEDRIAFLESIHNMQESELTRAKQRHVTLLTDYNTLADQFQDLSLRYERLRGYVDGVEEVTPAPMAPVPKICRRPDLDSQALEVHADETWRYGESRTPPKKWYHRE